MDHPDRAEPFLCDGQNVALAFLDGGRFAADPLGEDIDCKHHQRHDAKRHQCQFPVLPRHQRQRAGDGYDRGDDEGAFTVDALDGLGIVCDAEARVGAAPGVMVLEGQRLEVGVEFGAELEQGLQADPDKDQVRQQVQETGQEIDRDDRQAKAEDQERRAHGAKPAGQERRRRARLAGRKDFVDDDLEGPRFEEVEADSREHQERPQHRLPHERPEISEGAKVNGHPP